MAEKLVKILFFFLPLLTITCSEISPPMQESGQKDLKSKGQIFPSFHRQHFKKNKSTVTSKTTPHGVITPPTTVMPTNPTPAIVNTPNPVTTPVTTPVFTPITVPFTNPLMPPATVPITTPTTTPITVPITQPVTNPITNNPIPPPGSNPITATSPVVAGQSWCVAKAGALDISLQIALDYACGSAGADCSEIQQTGNCFIPNTIHNHASYAFNSYYQKNPIPSSCVFGGTSMLVNLNPSSGSCIFPSSSSSSSVLGISNLTSSTTIYGSGQPVYSDSVSTSVDLQFLVTFISLTSCIMGIHRIGV